jgi:hypothetical protein
METHNQGRCVIIPAEVCVAHSVTQSHHWHYARHVRYSLSKFPSLYCIRNLFLIGLNDTLQLGTRHRGLFTPTAPPARYAAGVRYSNKFTEVTEVWAAKSQQTRTDRRRRCIWKHDMNFRTVSSPHFALDRDAQVSSAVPGYQVTYRQKAGGHT